MLIEILLVALYTLAVVGAVYLIVPKMPTNMESILATTNGILESIEFDEDSTFYSIKLYAAEAVEAVEQLYKSGQLPKEERRQFAINFVKANLHYVGHDLEDLNGMLEIVIVGAVEAAVRALDK